MDPATIIGLAIAFGSLLAMILMEGASPMSVLLPAPMILVFGGTIAVGIASATIKDALHAVKVLPRAFLGKVEKPQVMIDKMVAIAEKARSDGLLSLEQEADGVDDPFLKGALQNIADGMDADRPASVLLSARESRIALQADARPDSHDPRVGSRCPRLGRPSPMDV